MSAAIKMARYSQGDPGLGSFLSGIGRTVSRAVGTVARVGTSLLPGPVGAIARGVVGLAGGGGAMPALPQLTGPTGTTFGQGALPTLAGPGQQGALFGPGVLTGKSTGGASVGKCTAGRHPNKHAYYRKTPGGAVARVDKGDACVPNRRMNPLNPKALHRAIRRLKAAKKWERELARVHFGAQRSSYRGSPGVITKREASKALRG